MAMHKYTSKLQPKKKDLPNRHPESGKFRRSMDSYTREMNSADCYPGSKPTQ